jgi:hypothetical protein
MVFLEAFEKHHPIFLSWERMHGLIQNIHYIMGENDFSMLKQSFYIKVFTDGGENDQNTLACYANPESDPVGDFMGEGVRDLFSCGPNHVYLIKFEWGGGPMCCRFDGQENTDYNYSGIGPDTDDPADHVIHLGSVFFPVPLGTVYSDLKVKRGEMNLLLPAPNGQDLRTEHKANGIYWEQDTRYIADSSMLAAGNS